MTNQSISRRDSDSPFKISINLFRFVRLLKNLVMGIIRRDCLELMFLQALITIFTGDCWQAVGVFVGVFAVVRIWLFIVGISEDIVEDIVEGINE